jgi:hypothetical protein
VGIEGVTRKMERKSSREQMGGMLVKGDVTNVRIGRDTNLWIEFRNHPDQKNSRGISCRIEKGEDHVLSEYQYQESLLKVVN